MSGRYPTGARLLHWAMAALLLSMLFLGAAMVDRWQPWATSAIQLHKAFGLLALVLAVLRLGNRLRFRAPPLPAGMPAAQRAVAHASHVLLYALMLALPLTGWAMQGAAGVPLQVAGWVLPALAEPDLARYGLLRELHAWLAYGLLGLVLLHAGAALHHGWVRRDGLLQRMTFGGDRAAEPAAMPDAPADPGVVTAGDSPDAAPAGADEPAGERRQV